ncbi:MAG: hypothetical protein V1882_04840 [Candidatus Omnitrophota bacterium]
MCPYNWLSLVVIVVVIASAIAAIFSRRASDRHFREMLASALNDPELRWEEKKPSFQYRDLNFSYKKYDGSRNSPPSFSVSVECRGTGGEFEISGEGGAERLFKNVGVVREVQTPEEEFNRRFYIASDTPQFAQSYFLFPEKREAVRRLFDTKASTVTHKGQGLTVTWKGSSSHADGVAAIKSASEALAVLAQEIPSCPDAASLGGIAEGDALNRVRMLSLVSRSFTADLISAIWSSWTSKGSSSHADRVAALKKTAEAMAVLAKDMPPPPEASLGRTGGRFAFNRVLMTGLAVGSLFAGLISTIWTTSNYPVFDAGKLFLFSLRFSLPALAIFLYFAVTTLAGNSRSHRDILTAGSFALAGFLLLGSALTGLYNGMNDTSAPVGHTMVIVDKRSHRSKHSRTYKMTVQSWRPGRAWQDLRTNRETYEKIVPRKQKAVIYTKPGKLGFEWLVTYRLSQ